MTPVGRRLSRALLYGLLTGLAGVLLRASLQSLLGDQLPFVVAFPATVLASVIWGSLAGGITALICASAVALPGVPPDLVSVNVPLQVGGFLIGSLFIAVLCGQLSRLRFESTDDGRQSDSALSTWLRAVLWGAFLIPLTLFLLISWWGYQRAQLDAFATVNRASELALDHARRTFNITRDIARKADVFTSGDDASVRAREKEIHQRFADITTGLPSIVNLNVWDANGQPLARSDIYPVSPSSNVSDREYFQEQRRGLRGMGISEVLTGRQTGMELTNATLARTSADASFRGVIAVSLAPRFFRDYYESLAKEQPHLANFSLVRTDGELIARWPPLTDGRRRVNDTILSVIKENVKSGVVEIPATGGREARIASFRRVEGYPLYVVAGVSREAVYASWGRFVALLGGILLPISGVLVFVSWVALKRTQREAATAAQLQEQIRRRGEAEQAALQSQKLETLAAVTGGVAHDFNNLLAIVNTSLHLLNRRHPELHSEKQVQAISRAVQTGMRLTRQLLSFTRKQALRPEYVDLRSWLPAVESLIRTTLGSGITWSMKVEPDTRTIFVDTAELELALINLVVNARHAMPNGGSLNIHASNEPPRDSGSPMVAIRVGDSGVGIPPGLLSKVFEPFFSTRAKGVGSGLGLSQVQGFCSEAGGSVEIKSAVGAGTTVCLYLPSKARSATEVNDAAATVTAGENARVVCDTSEANAEKVIALDAHGAQSLLLVEDNEDVASTTETMLRDSGFDVIRKPNASSALEHLNSAEVRPVAVISDIAMPGSMDGIKLAFTVKESYPGLPVVLTTGYAERLNQAVEGGLTVLPKPVDPEVLLSELAKVIPPTGA
jgi:two-component system NtrC family sensor kinase